MNWHAFCYIRAFPDVCVVALVLEVYGLYERLYGGTGLDDRRDYSLIVLYLNSIPSHRVITRRLLRL